MSKTICIFGDSITHGVLDEEMGGWANRLKVYFWEYSDEYLTNIYDLGVDGETASGLLSRCEMEIKSRNPNIVIFAIGINDSTYYADGRVLIEEGEFKNNLEKLIQIAHKFTSEVVFIGLTPIVEKMLQPYLETGESYSTDRVATFDSIISETCAKQNVHYITMQDIVDSRSLPDGLHPDVNTHQKIFVHVRDFLIKNKII